MQSLILAATCNEDVMHVRRTLEPLLKSIVMHVSKINDENSKHLMTEIEFNVPPASPPSAAHQEVFQAESGKGPQQCSLQRQRVHVQGLGTGQWLQK